MVSKKAYRSNSLTLSEQELLLNVVTNYQDLVLFKLALTTGIRREDIVGIELQGVNLEDDTLTFWEAKKKRFWTVPIHPEAKLEVQRYLKTIPKGQKKLFTFCGKTAYNHLQYYLKKAGITKPISFHDLRRSFVKTARKKGLSPKAVSQITGDSLHTIEEYYSNLDMDELQEELNKL